VHERDGSTKELYDAECGGHSARTAVAL
jgi:hypothetical protein